MQGLQEAYPAPIPSQHRRHQGEENKNSRDAYGVYYFAFWKAVGHPDANPTLSKDILQGGHRFNAVLGFLKDITPLTQSISMLFEAVDNPAYEDYSKTYQQWLGSDATALSTIHTCGRACFLGTAVLRNFQVRPHKDSRDPRDGWVGMTCFGDFQGGELVVPELGCKFQYQEGDVVFFRSAVLKHFVTAFEGERSAFVWFTKDDMFENREM